MSDHFRIDEEGGKHEPTNPKPELGTCYVQSSESQAKYRTCNKLVRNWQPLASPQERCPNCGELKSDPTDECIHKFHNHGTPSASEGGRDETELLRQKQSDADKAWAYLQSKDVLNLDIERPGKDKVTLTELLSEYSNLRISDTRKSRTKQREIDVKNLRFYSKMADENKWHIDHFGHGVIVQTLREIADRLEREAKR